MQSIKCVVVGDGYVHVKVTVWSVSEATEHACIEQLKPDACV